MKILIIGSKGMLGGALAEAFAGEELFLWDLEDIDITDEKQVQEKIGELKPDVIINAAAYNAVDKCETEEGFAIAKKVNGEGPGYLAAIAKDLGAVFVHYSSDYIFGGEMKKEGFKEDDEPSPVNKYGESKLLGEQAVQKYGDKYYILRTCKLFGKIGKSEVAKKSFVDLMLQLASERDKLEVVDEEYASPTYALDLAKRTKEIILSGEVAPAMRRGTAPPRFPYGIYHVTNSDACTWYEFAKEIFKIKNTKLAGAPHVAGHLPEIIPVSSDKFPRPARRPKFSVLLNTKLPKMRSWREALEEYLNIQY